MTVFIIEARGSVQLNPEIFAEGSSKELVFLTAKDKVEKEDKLELRPSDLREEILSWRPHQLEGGFHSVFTDYLGRAYFFPKKKEIVNNWIRFKIANNENLGDFHKFVKSKIEYRRFARPKGKQIGTYRIKLKVFSGFVEVINKSELAPFDCSIFLALHRSCLGDGFEKIYLNGRLHKSVTEFELEVFDLRASQATVRRACAKFLLNEARDFTDVYHSFVIAKDFIPSNPRGKRFPFEEKDYKGALVNKVHAISMPKFNHTLRAFAEALFEKNYSLLSEFEVKTPERCFKIHNHHAACLIMARALQEVELKLKRKLAEGPNLEKQEKLKRCSYALQKAFNLVYRTYVFSYIEGKPLFKKTCSLLLLSLPDQNYEIHYGDYEVEMNIAYGEFNGALTYPHDFFKPSDIEGIFKLRTFVTYPLKNNLLINIIPSEMVREGLLIMEGNNDVY